MLLFRRNGKPTSLGCFDEESEAARAYDKMMIWCELHNSNTLKAGITNFDMSEYEKDITLLNSLTQVRHKNLQSLMTYGIFVAQTTLQAVNSQG